MVLFKTSLLFSQEKPAFALRPSILPLSAKECRLLKIHRPAEDVTYQPGVASDGSPVTPADLPDPTMAEVPEVISFDLLKRPAGPGGLLLEGSVGTLSVNVATGVLALNGKRLSPPRAVIRCTESTQVP